MIVTDKVLNCFENVAVKGKITSHLASSGVSYGIKSVIGPGCVLNVKSFYEEIEYLKPLIDNYNETLRNYEY